MPVAGTKTVSNSSTHSQGNTVDIHVGARLREARENRNLSRAKVAMAIGVSEVDLDLLEKGTLRVGAARLYDLCKALDQSVSYFFSGYKSVTEIGGGDLVGRASRLLRAFTKLTVSEQEALCDQASRMAGKDHIAG